MHKTFSPLRYPGGKSQFYDKVEKILFDNKLLGCSYLEPFAGGAGVGLRLLFEGKVGEIYINDNDYCIYCFWHSILNHHHEFIKILKDTPITIDEWNRQRNIYLHSDNYSKIEVGFATFFLNRTNRSGILKAGPIGGKEQKGTYKIDCRFNKEDLIKKIESIAFFRNKIRLSKLDACTFIKKYKNLNDSFWFIDPPYFNAGSELYKNFFKNSDHTKLSRLISNSLKDKSWILTYDYCKEIFALYKKYEYGEILLTYSVENKRQEKEYLFFNNLEVSKEIFYGIKY